MLLTYRENEIEKIQQTLENIQAVKNNVEQTLNEIMNEKQENSHVRKMKRYLNYYNLLQTFF